MSREDSSRWGGLTKDKISATCDPKGLLMKKSVVCLLLAASLTCATSAYAQEYYPEETAIQKEKGTFLGYIGHDAVAGNDEFSTLELGVKWVGLLGQPVEDYTFRWENNGFYHLPGGATKLNRYDLESYPDLLARYDNIRPSSLVLRMSVSADPVDSSTPTPHHFSGGGGGFSLGTKYVRSTPHMVVLRADCRSSNLIASSPPKNRDFIDWNRSLSSGDPDKSAQNTLAGAKQITLSSLRVESVEWPMTRIQSIYDELQDRTNVPEDREAAAAKAELDSFWGNDRPGVSGKRMTSSVRLDRCPDEGVLKAEEAVKIERQSENNYNWMDRVVSEDGRVLIQWTDKRIYKYENGEAMAYQEWEERTKVLCSIIRSGGSKWDEFQITSFYVGRINASGNWVNTPKVYGLISYNECGSSGTPPRAISRGVKEGFEVIDWDGWDALTKPAHPLEHDRR